MKAVFFALAAFFATLSPASSHEADKYVVWCTQPDTRAACEKGTKEIFSLYKKAYKGNHQAQRNLAYALQNGDFPARKDPIASCMWRLIIVSSSSTKVDDSDFSNLKYMCGRLSEMELSQAKVQATTLAQRMIMHDKIDDSIDKPGPTLDSTAEPLSP